jgi:hypothetical protein
LQALSSNSIGLVTEAPPPQLSSMDGWMDGWMSIFRIPVRLQRRGGRKLIMTPEGAVPTPKRRRDDT